jgi:hypothetical protein
MAKARRKDAAMGLRNLDGQNSVIHEMVSIRTQLLRPDREDAWRVAAVKVKDGEDATRDADMITHAMLKARIGHVGDVLTGEPFNTYPQAYRTLLHDTLVMTLATGALRDADVVSSVVKAIASTVDMALRESGIEASAFKRDVAQVVGLMIHAAPPEAKPGPDCLFDADKGA